MTTKVVSTVFPLSLFKLRNPYLIYLLQIPLIYTFHT